MEHICENSMQNTIDIFNRLAQRELALCVILNRICDYDWLKQSLRFISWLGNGKFWYGLILLLPVIHGPSAWTASLHMTLIGIVGFLIYKIIKSGAERLRPYACSNNINLVSMPLDTYSFPSGHTLHAVNFTIIASYYFPDLAIILLPFTVLTGLARVVLGLHYPTDVVIGGLIGFLISLISLSLI